jgi:hypothetical protein
MMISAVLTTRSKDAASVSAALDVDNVQLDGLSVRTKTRKDTIITEIAAGSIKTLIRALDDIICCQIVAEKTIA